MDNLELKNSLKEQKIPFDEAVRKKLEYLKSDEVFSTDNDQYIMIMRNIRSSQGDVDSLIAAFGDNDSTLSPNNQISRPVSNITQRPLNNTSSQPTPAQNRQMTMAERIAALRGALYVPKEFQHK